MLPLSYPSFRHALTTLIFALASVAGAAAAAIDRPALIARHAVHVDRVDPESSLSVGNGDFAFTVDVTGLQSFEKLYHDKGIPLETLSTWAWHSFPNVDGLRLEDAMLPYNFHGRSIKYAGKQDSPAGAYFRQNPHPIALGQLSLVYKGKPVSPEQLSEINQTLDLWTGVIRSAYKLDGKLVVVETTAHASASEVSIRLQSPLLQDGSLSVHLRFPYSYEATKRNKPPFDWGHQDKHTSVLKLAGTSGGQIARTIDDSRYFVQLQLDGKATIKEDAPHDFSVTGKESEGFSLVCRFAPDGEAAAAASKQFDETLRSSARGWQDYWTKGGVVDFSGSRDPRAAELERRVVLSQYLVRVNYAGNVPPSEDGLTNVTWFGKHNSEMYYWHAAQFYGWGHVDLLEKGLAWYLQILPLALTDARAQGFEGARWPKMAGIDGRPSPGTINPFIIWNQPNPIALCELVYRAHPERATLDKYQQMVFESARFLASFAHLDEATNRYVLGPPIKNVSEKNGENNTQNPTFELAYWYYGLQVAQKWRERLGQAPEPHWAEILLKLSKLPVSEGKYLEIETVKDLYEEKGNLPTTMLMILGFMPKIDFVDTETLRRTFDEVNRRNGPNHWTSWALGQGALTAARLGETETAVSILTNPVPQARFMNNGHVRRPKEPDGCPAYLPVNASLLNAVALMAAGWDGAPKVNAPGFPQDGSWTVRSEGLKRMP